MREAFDIYDRNKDGGISFVELTNVLYALGYNATHLEILDLMKQVDTNGDGKIDFNEFKLMMEKHKQSTRLLTQQQELEEAFRAFDINGDGKLTRDELRKVLKMLGSDMTEEELELIISTADVDHSGALNLEEFKRFVMTDMR